MNHHLSDLLFAIAFIILITIDAVVEAVKTLYRFFNPQKEKNK